jgi:hypothetical protein
MGVDISGRKPINDDGDYFSSNWWAWRPIHMLSEVAIEVKNLKMNTDGWGSNDGKGLRTQKQCDRLADALEEILKNEFSNELEEENDRIYYCMGSWVEAGTGTFYSENTEQLNDEYPYGTILHSAVVTKDGKLVVPAHSSSLVHIQRWIKFLRNCGGFRIF